MENRTIENYTRSTQSQDRQTTTSTPDTNTTSLGWTMYANIFALNLVHRFPNLETIDTINVNNIARIARLCAVSSQIALVEYEEINAFSNQEQLAGQKFKKAA